jgi:hypothetical protein
MPNLHVVRVEQEPDRSKASGAVDSYQLVTKSGVAFGLIELARPDWPLGVIIDRDATKLRVIEIVPPERAGELPILVVEPA